MTHSHAWMRYSATPAPPALARRIAAATLNRLMKQELSASQYRKAGKLTVSGHRQVATGAGKRLEPYSVQMFFDDLVDHIRTARALDLAHFGIDARELSSGDFSVAHNIAPTPDATGSTLKIVLSGPLGPNFPLQPRLDREGAGWTSFQGPVLTNIAALHATAVGSSAGATTRAAAWLNTLRMLVAEVVSLVDITLHDLYFRAKYRPVAGWRFDEAALGPRHGQRVRDKLRWVGQITGTPLDDVQRDVDAFIELKDLRNHFSHFDPPCVAFSVEDAVRWLNLVPFVGELVWAIRRRAGDPLGVDLAQVILLPLVEFLPRGSGPRAKQGADCGYASSKWQTPT